jgi:hypothetical protein
LTRLEQAIQHRRTEQPPADAERLITLLEAAPLLFACGFCQTPALGFRPGNDGRPHIVITCPRYGASTNRFDMDYDAMLDQLAPAFDAEWQAAGCPRLLLLTREQTTAAIEGIDRGELELRADLSFWWGTDAAAKRIPWTEIDLLTSTARVLYDQGETVNSLADLRALLTEGLAQKTDNARPAVRLTPSPRVFTTFLRGPHCPDHLSAVSTARADGATL